MKTIIIVAISRNHVIGRDSAIPWHYAADMKHFRRATMGHPIIVGRKTFESFPRRPLPGRTNIVLSRSPDYPVPDGVLLCRSPQEARIYCCQHQAEKMFILGGADIYRQTLPLTDEMMITHIPEEVEGDTFFPAWNRDEWEVVDSREEDGLSFVTYRHR